MAELHLHEDSQAEQTGKANGTNGPAPKLRTSKWPCASVAGERKVLKSAAVLLKGSKASGVSFFSKGSKRIRSEERLHADKCCLPLSQIPEQLWLCRKCYGRPGDKQQNSYAFPTVL